MSQALLMPSCGVMYVIVVVFLLFNRHLSRGVKCGIPICGFMLSLKKFGVLGPGNVA